MQPIHKIFTCSSLFTLILLAGCTTNPAEPATSQAKGAQPAKANAAAAPPVQQVDSGTPVFPGILSRKELPTTPHPIGIHNLEAQISSYNQVLQRNQNKPHAAMAMVAKEALVELYQTHAQYTGHLEE